MFNHDMKTNKDLLLTVLSIVISSVIISLLMGLTMYGLFSLTVEKLIVYPSMVVIMLLYLCIGWLLSEYLYTLINGKVCKVDKPTVSKN